VTRLVLFWLLMAATLPAAVIRGTIVENRTGKPLSRVTLVLQPIGGTPGNSATIRSDNFGGFIFGSLAPGTYTLKATRRGFLPMEFGQKMWNSAGQPVVLAEDAPAFLNLRLFRYSGITGTIVDENDIGLMDHEVVAYRNVQPPQVVAHGRSDDHGVYRIGGLEPGVYLVRTAGAQDEEVSYVPTFAKETQLVRDGRIVQLFPDEDASGMDIRPATGKLFTLSGSIVPCPLPPQITPPLTVTLATELGRRTAKVVCGFQFDGLPPGPAELYVQFPDPPSSTVLTGAYQEVNISRNNSVNLVLPPELRATTFNIIPSPPGGWKNLEITARRKDLAGVGPAAPLILENNRAMIAPGRWEVFLQPPAGQYVSYFYGPGYGRSRARSDGWNEFISNNTGSVQFTLSGGPGEMHGIVKYSGDVVSGAPVFLEGYDPETHTRVTDLRVTRTDKYGAYRFDGLAPGNYRILSTFEYMMPDVAAMDMAGAQSLRVEAHSTLQTDLDLWGIR
jgi:hypothetical protein